MILINSTFSTENIITRKNLIHTLEDLFSMQFNHLPNVLNTFYLTTVRFTAVAFVLYLTRVLCITYCAIHYNIACILTSVQRVPAVISQSVD